MTVVEMPNGALGDHVTLKWKDVSLLAQPGPLSISEDTLDEYCFLLVNRSFCSTS